MSFKLAENLFHKIDRKEALRGFVIFLLFILGAIMLSRSIGQEKLEQRVIDAGIRGPIFVIIRKALSVIFVPFSGSITYALAGSLYGTGKAIIFSILGNAIGISVAFFIGRIWGKKTIQWIVGKKHVHEVIHLVEHLSDVKTFTITRLILFPLEDFINYAAGMSKLGFWVYFIISLSIATLISLGPIIFGHLLI